MPRQQVYGKRSKVDLEAVAIFADVSSSPSAKSDGHEATRKSTVLSERRKNDDGSRQEHQKGERHSRKALGEVSGNCEVTETCHAVRRTVRRRPKTKETQCTTQEGCQETTVTKSQIRQKRSASRPRINGTSEICTVTPSEGTVQRAQKECGALDESNTIVAKHSRSKRSPTVTISSRTCEGLATPHQPQDIYTTHAASLLSLSAHEITSYAEWSTQLSSHFHLTKIAEASYGEVYRLSLQPRLVLPGFSSTDESVLKIIALQSPASSLPKDKRKLAAALRKQDAMSKVDDVANEVKLLQRMSSIPGFTNFRDMRIVRGKPPPAFIEAFQSFNTTQQAKGKELSVFPDPAKKTSYAEDQLWAVIEMQDAGSDLERSVEDGKVSSIWAIWDVFWQVVLTLGKGEEAAEFEHRDLHLGNICIRRTSTSSTEMPSSPPDEGMDLTKNLNFSHLETTIIDYTLSRALMPCSSSQQPSSPSSSPNRHSRHDSPSIAFHDLAHPSNTALFEADSTDEYQYDIYRYMRDIACPAAPTTTRLHASSPWSSFHPRTNLIWLHFLLHQLFAQPDLNLPSAAVPAKSATTAVRRAYKRGKTLERALRAVQELLEPNALIAGDGPVQGASDLVALALGEGWLGVADVVGGEDGQEELEEDREEMLRRDDRKDSADGLVDALAELHIESTAAAGVGPEEADAMKTKRRRGRAEGKARKPTTAA